jgi:hypothetical protein
MLNEYFTLASDAIFACGEPSTSSGGAPHMFFGAPLDQGGLMPSAPSTLRCDPRGRERAEPYAGERGELLSRSASRLNTGDAIVGDIGSQRRVDYTVLATPSTWPPAWRSW